MNNDDDELMTFKDGLTILLYLIIAGTSIALTVKLIQVIYYLVDKFIIGCP